MKLLSTLLFLVCLIPTAKLHCLPDNIALVCNADAFKAHYENLFIECHTTNQLRQLYAECNADITILDSFGCLCPAHKANLTNFLCCLTLKIQDKYQTTQEIESLRKAPTALNLLVGPSS